MTKHKCLYDDDDGDDLSVCVCVYTHVFNSVLFRFRRRLSLSAGGIRRLSERSGASI